MTPPASYFCAAVIAALGTLLYAVLAFGIAMPLENPYFGIDLYDAYYYRLLDGRFDLPLRMLRQEGHYTADGTGILYHGLSPLLTRVMLDPFVTLHQFPTAAASVWLWAVLGAAMYHLAAFQIIGKFARDNGADVPLIWVAMTGLAVWLCGPGLMISANSVLYHEPIAIAYAAMAVAVYLMLRCAVFGMPWHRAIIPCAVLAGVLVHSRPHMAAGLYVAVVAMAVLSYHRKERGARFKGVIGLAILGVLALSFLQLNSVRFGSAIQSHGAFDTPGTTQGVQIGSVFLATDYTETGPGRAYREHGTFHPWRVVPNLFVYTFDFPPIADPVADGLRAVTENISGYGNVEAPRFGMLSIWPVWIILLVAGPMLARPRIWGGVSVAPVLFATGITAGLMLSYPTIAFRYRFELWPFVMVIGVLSLPGLLQRFGPKLFQNTRLRDIALIALLGGAAMTGRATIPYLQSYETAPGRNYATWDADTCAAKIAHHNYPVARVAQLCVEPQSVFDERDGQ